MHPDDASYKWRVAESRFNLGDTLLDQGELEAAIEQLSLASPVLASRARDKADVRAQLASLMNDSTLAWTQFNAGRVELGEKALLDSERAFVDLASRYDNLQVTFYVGQTHMRLGALYIARASRPGLAPSAQLEHWRKARDWLTKGKTHVEKVGAVIHLEGTEAEMLQTGLANLAKAEAAVSRLSGRAVR
jgi:hypothetical protein